MSLAEFNKKTPVDMSIPRVGDINDPQWNTMDLSKSKDPSQQAKLFNKKLVEPTAQAAAASEPATILNSSSNQAQAAAAAQREPQTTS